MVILEFQFISPPDEDPKKRPKPKGLLPEEIKHIMTRETYELEIIINKKLFKPYSPEYKKLYQI